MSDKVIIGRDYYAAPILRRLPSGWQLEEAKRKGSRRDKAVLWICVGLFAAFYAFNIWRAFV